MSDAESDRVVSGSFRLEDGVLLVRHHASGRCKRVPIGEAPHVETLAKVILLELEDAAGRSPMPPRPDGDPP